VGLSLGFDYDASPDHSKHRWHAAGTSSPFASTQKHRRPYAGRTNRSLAKSTRRDSAALLAISRIIATDSAAARFLNQCSQ
jgi:hypothetical protein